MHTIKFQRLCTVAWVRGWLWYVAFALAMFVVAWEGLSFVRVLYPGLAPRDFFQEWASAKNAFHDLPIYAPQVETIPYYLGIAARPGRSFIPVNAHPPVSVLLALPFAAFEYPLAHLLWNLFSLAALGVSVTILVRTLGLPTGLPLGVVLTFVLTSGPMRNQLFHGQLNLVLLSLLIGVWWADRSGHPIWAGVWLGLATAIKLFPGLLFLYFALRRRKPTLVSGIASVAICCMTAATFLGPEAFLTYGTDVIPTLAVYRADPQNSSVAGLVHKLFDPGAQARYVEPIFTSPWVASLLTGTCCGAILLVVGAAILRARSRKERDLAFGLVVVAMVLVSPIAWDHYFLLLLLPLGLLWKEMPSRGPYLPALLCILALMWLPYWRINRWADLLLGREPSMVADPYYSLAVLSLHLYALLGLFGLTLLTFRRSLASAESSRDPNSDSQPCAAFSTGRAIWS